MVPDERDDEGAGEIGRGVIQRASAFGQAQRLRVQGERESLEPFHECIGARERDRAVRERAGRLSCFSEHVQRMKTARERAVCDRFFQNLEINSTAAVHAGRARAPLDSRGDCLDRIVGHGEKNEIDTVGDFLRRADPRARNSHRELLRGRGAPARDRDNFDAGLRESHCEPRPHAARADETECELFRRHLLPIVRKASPISDKQNHFEYRVNFGVELTLLSSCP